MLNLLLVFIMLVPGVPAPKWWEKYDDSEYPEEVDDSVDDDTEVKTAMHLKLLSLLKELTRLGGVSELQVTQWTNRMNEANRLPIADFKRVAFQIANEIMAAHNDFQRSLQEQLIAGDRRRVEAQLKVVKALIGPVRLFLGGL